MKAKLPLHTKNFSKKLRQLRLESGLSQKDIADKIGADLQRVSKYERGVVYPTTDIIVKIAEAFQVSIDYLLRDNINKTDNKIENLKLKKYIEEINNLPEQDLAILTNLLDAYIKRRKFEELMQT
ncbi:MAG: helix-turn-helix transcriptional regulator [Desulfobacterales bacterium]|nr:helix-turn-helix transcriptional regulator [Desulfobacterales bacterium]